MVWKNHGKYPFLHGKYGSMGWEIWICPNFPRDLLSFEADLLFPESRFGQARSMRMGNLHLQSETPGEYGDQAFSEFNFKAAGCAEDKVLPRTDPRTHLSDLVPSTRMQGIIYPSAPGSGSFIHIFALL